MWALSFTYSNPLVINIVIVRYCKYDNNSNDINKVLKIPSFNYSSCLGKHKRIVYKIMRTNKN